MRETALCLAQLRWRDRDRAHRQFRLWMRPPPSPTPDDAEATLNRACWRIMERIVRDPRVPADVQLHYWRTLPSECWPRNAKD
jgi:hypothetical protein